MTLTAQDIKKIAARAYSDPVFFCSHFLSEWFPGRIPWVHRGMLAILSGKTDFLWEYGELDKIASNFVYKKDRTDPDSELIPLFIIDKKNKKITLRKSNTILIMLPRGFAKTTIMNAMVLYYICFQERKFPFYLSASGSHSATQLRSIRVQLESNAVIHAVFGNLVPDRTDGKKWTDNFIQTTHGISVMARGRGGQVRGSNVSGQRPDLFIIDDVENEESVISNEQRQKTRKWFYEAVVPALPALDDSAGIVVCGTQLHFDGLLTYLAADPDWVTINFGVTDKQGDPLWPENMNLVDIENRKASFQRVGNLAGFYREYYNMIKDEDTALFKQSYFQYRILGRNEFAGVALVYDPAISKKDKADYSTFAVVGMAKDGALDVLESIGQRGMTPREAVDMLFELYRIWRPSRVGVEAIGYQRSFIHLAREEMARRGLFFEIEAITHGRVAKEDRIRGVLQPRYAAGFIWHRKAFPFLESQLLDFPYAKHDDFPDSVAMSATLLDRYANFAINPEFDLAGSTLPPLERVVGGDFRTAP
jgi:hypothetical protein